jgi:hypothetical protein
MDGPPHQSMDGPSTAGAFCRPLVVQPRHYPALSSESWQLLAALIWPDTVNQIFLMLDPPPALLFENPFTGLMDAPSDLAKINPAKGLVDATPMENPPANNS